MPFPAPAACVTLVKAVVVAVVVVVNKVKGPILAARPTAVLAEPQLVATGGCVISPRSIQLQM